VRSLPGQEPQPQPIDEPRTTTESWHEFEANIQAVERAAQRVAAQRAERHASSEYAARIEREAVAEPESGRQAEARDGAEMDL
jgi:hypothetical protein